MTKICVVSDTHGFAGNMLWAIENEKPDMLIHLGDGETDLISVRAQYPDLKIENVQGNCDTHSTAWVVFQTTIEGRRIFATHGDRHQVKLDPQYTTLLYAALEVDANIVLFGHTHQPYVDRRLCMDVMNPGSCGNVACPTYGVITIYAGDVHMRVREARP